MIKKIAANFSYMFIIQILNMAIPFIYYPYLVHSYGIKEFGIFVQAQVILSLLAVFVDFGINVAFVSLANRAKYNIEKCISYSIALKSCILVISLIVLFLLSLINVYISNIYVIIALMIGSIVFDIFVPIWYYQISDRLKIFSLLTFSAKALTLCFIFLFIDDTSSLYLLALIWSLSYVPAILFGVINTFKIELNFRDLFKTLNVIEVLRFCYPFFTSSVTSIGVSRISSILVGVKLGPEASTIFDFVEKILALSLMPFTLLNQAIYPIVAKTKDLSITYKVLMLTAPFGVAYYTLFFYFGEPLLNIIFPASLVTNIQYLYFLLIIVPVNSVSYFLGTTFLVIINREKDFRKSVFFGMIGFVITLIVGVVMYEISVWLVVISIFAYHLLILLTRTFFASLYLKNQK